MMDQGHLGHTLNAGDTEDTLWTLFLRTLGSLIISEEDLKDLTVNLQNHLNWGSSSQRYAFIEKALGWISTFNAVERPLYGWWRLVEAGVRSEEH